MPAAIATPGERDYRRGKARDEIPEPGYEWDRMEPDLGGQSFMRRLKQTGVQNGTVHIDKWCDSLAW